MSALKVGDYVRCIDNSGSHAQARLSTGRLYKVRALTGTGPNSEVYLEGINGQTWMQSRFEVAVPAVTSPNPCAEVGVNADVDWKSRYENMKHAHDALNDMLHAIKRLKGSADLYKKCYYIAADDLLAARSQKTVNPAYVKELEENLQAYRDAVRPMLPENLDHPICPEDVRAVAKRYVTMDRQTFLASTYNWARQGLTMAEAAHDLFKFILKARGEEPAGKDTKLQPPRTYTLKASDIKFFIDKKEFFPSPTFDLSVRYTEQVKKDIEKRIDDAVEVTRDILRATLGEPQRRAWPPYGTPPKPPENNCPDKLEPCSHRGERCNHKP